MKKLEATLNHVLEGISTLCFLAILVIVLLAAAPAAAPSSGFKKISPINEPQNPPETAPAAVRLWT